MPDFETAKQIEVLFSLLPGLVTYLIVHKASKAHEKIELAEATLQGLAFTILNYATWEWVSSSPYKILTVPRTTGVVLCALVWGFAISLILNKGWGQRLLFWSQASSLPPWGTVWHSGFRENDQQYVVLNLKDGRRLFGYPKGFPHKHEGDYILLQRATWLEDPGAATQQVRSGMVMIDAGLVEHVEFVPQNTNGSSAKEQSNEPRHLLERSKSATNSLDSWRGTDRRGMEPPAAMPATEGSTTAAPSASEKVM